MKLGHGKFSGLQHETIIMLQKPRTSHLQTSNGLQVKNTKPKEFFFFSINPNYDRVIIRKGIKIKGCANI
jgi:hypothetical protein